MSGNYQSIADELAAVTQRFHETQEGLMIQGREMKRLQSELSAKTAQSNLKLNSEINGLKTHLTFLHHKYGI
ncbi:uncharacterized protein ACA1_056990 [Acanthamoeba castellanii str. Neff]|uniref:Uncharacterized protein n=1 Tax=Acanthamoeba castellanii (strain ATCC 30010 / Neff) TaxID=1257118 RepID=L8GVW0_ACACF|nr:uncharacterized protein ACA1_056990 [Acanthamoeba castellanii str. Neff]ELR17067.1 hypothetical protein ACA1_056990 [Acanthamoeba castellanii str. Neff]